ncbi:MAG: LamG domain-containing protein, partial [bacterium]
MKNKQMFAVPLALVLFLLPRTGSAASQTGFRVTAPPAFPIFNTNNAVAWAATNGASVIWSSGGSSVLPNGHYPQPLVTGSSTPQYRLIESVIGSPVEHIKPEYYLGEQITPPALNIDWTATFSHLTNSAAYTGNAVFYDRSVPGIFLSEGGLIQIDWILTDGSTNAHFYQVSGSAKQKPYRIYWTDEPYNSPPVDLTGKFVKFFGNPDIINLKYAAVTSNAGGMPTTITNVVSGLFLDPSTHWLKAIGGIQGMVVVAYYRTGSYTELLGSIVVEVCAPDTKTVQGVIGSQLLPTGDGYDDVGLNAMVTAGMTSDDDVGPYVYQYKGQHSYSPKNGNIYAIRKTVGESWKIEVYWRQEDLMGTSWPFEVLHYACDWPTDAEKFVRGQESDANGSVNYGLTVTIPSTYTATLMEFQEPAGHASLASSTFSSESSGYSLLKLNGTDLNGDDNMWFLPIQSVLRNDPQFDLTPGTWPVGLEVQPLPTSVALAFDGSSAFLQTTISNQLHSSFTVECYFQVEQPARQQMLFHKNAISNSLDFQVEIKANGQVCAALGAPASTVDAQATIACGDGVWHHVALVYDQNATNVSLVLDGVQTTAGVTGSRTASDRGTLSFGRDPASAINGFLKGKMDDIRIWSRALGTNDIQSGTAGFMHGVATATNLVAYYPIDNGLGRTLMDASTNRLDAAMINCVRTAPGAIGLSDMDGFSQYHGYIYEAVSGNNYNTNLYVRPDQLNTGSDPTATGTDETYIFAVNKTTTKPLEVWWSHEVSQEAMPDAIWFPSWVQRYTFDWPTDKFEVPEIVLASQLGSANRSLVKRGGAVDFSQSFNSRMSVPAGAWFAGENYTVECWIKPHSFGPASQVFNFNNGDSLNSVSLTIHPGSNYTYVVSESAGGVHREISPASTNTLRNGWNHLALVVAGGVPTIYQNGHAVYTNALPTVPYWAVSTTNNHLAYGVQGGTTNSFDGQIDEFRVWSVARSGSDVLHTMLTELTGQELGLELNYTFDNNIGTTSAAISALDHVHGVWAPISYASWAIPGAPRLDTGVLITDEAPFVYYQNDITLPGYNPNEEHAFVMASDAGYVTYALRNDLNLTSSSEPYVLVQYNDPANAGRPKIQIYQVVLTNELYTQFADTMTAGTLVPGPHPLDLLPDPWNMQTKWDKEDHTNSLESAGYQDRKLQVWGKCAGTNGTTTELVMYNYYPMMDSFFFPSLALGNKPQPAHNTPIPWLCRSENASNADVLTGTPHKWTWTVKWPDYSPVIDIGQTLTKAFQGLPEVWAAKSIELIYEPTAEAVALYDPVVIQTAALEFEGDFATAFGFDAGPRGNIQMKNGKIFFKGVPPNVSDRFYFDPAAAKTSCLKLSGRLVENTGGLGYLQLNVLTDEERTALKGLVSGSSSNEWAAAIKELAMEHVDTDDAHGVVNYAMTHMGAGAGGFVTLIENDTTNKLFGVNEGDPIQMHVIQLSTNLFTGSLLPLKDPYNLLSEQLDILYTESFAGNANQFVFEWKRAEPNEDGTTPTDYENGYSLYRSITNGLTRFTIGKQGDTLVDMVNNFYVMRYRATSNSLAYGPTGGAWSGWVMPTLAEGWVQRVVNSVTPFTQRMQDLYNNPAETQISMIQQAGGPYEGDISLNQDNLTSVGLIQLYQTVLNKAESMSLMLGINNTAANQQLMLAATRLNDLYMLLGNEAYADAMDPTIGFGSDYFNSDDFSLGAIDYGAMSSSLFCFDNLMPNLRDEELALLRGRSDQLAPSHQLSPTYNRLYWNFTKGITAGEVAYAMNYQIFGNDPTIDQPQAAAMYPQGHGDAWGHYLSALNGYYRLLRNPYFSWGTPSISPMMVGDAVVDSDYYDEEKFAQAAAAMARTGVEVVKRTCEKVYVENGTTALAGYVDSDANRAFGYGEWGSRAGLAALYNWAAANSLLPPPVESESSAFITYTDDGLQRITRDSVGSLEEVCAAMKDVQRSVDQADAGMTPLGLSGSAISFDIDPAALATGQSHFEQIEARAEQALANAATLLDRAQGVSKLQRQQAQSASNMQQDLLNEEAGLNTQLIAIFGYPYSADIGAGATYPQGYDGPDLYHYMWMDLASYGFKKFELETKTSTVFRTTLATTVLHSVSNETSTLSFDLAANGMVLKPDGIGGTRRAAGRLQASYGSFIQAYRDYRKALLTYEEKTSFLEAEAGWAGTKIGINSGLEAVGTALQGYEVIHSFKEIASVVELYGMVLDDAILDKTFDSVVSSVPEMVIAGMAVGVDVGSPIKAAMNGIEAPISTGMETMLSLQKMKYEISQSKLKAFKDIFEMIKDLAKLTFEDHETVAEVEKIVMEVNDAAMALDVSHAALVNAQESFLSVLAEGEQVLSKRESLRKQAVNRIAAGRYQDMAFRTFRSDALAKYGNAFDLAKKYTYLATKAYDYETALGLGNAYGSDSIFREIVGARTLGFMENGEAQLGGLHGDGGLADVLARLKANWLLLKGRLGINNPQTESCWLSLRSELFRIQPTGVDAQKAWQDKLASYRVDNLLDNPDF